MKSQYSKFLDDNLIDGNMGLLKDFLERDQLIAARDQTRAEIKKLKKNLETVKALRDVLNDGRLNPKRVENP